MIDLLKANVENINLLISYIALAITLLSLIPLSYTLIKHSDIFVKNQKNIKQLHNGSKEEQQATDVTMESLIRSFYEQALFQASIQFWFSLITSVIGFVFIISMIIAVNNAEWYEYVFKILPGTIIETVSVLFFKQSSEARKQASEYFDKLRSDEQITKSVVIANSIEDEDIRSSVKAKISLHMCGIDEAYSSVQKKD